MVATRTTVNDILKEVYDTLIRDQLNEEASSLSSLLIRGRNLLRRFRDWHVSPKAYPKNASGWRWEIEPSEPTVVHDGQRLPQEGGDLEVIHTPGHTMGSVCIRHPACLFSGDHVLPDISPNVGGGDRRRA